MATRVAITGKMHAGKTTLAKALVVRGFHHYAFANPVKEFSTSVANDVTSMALYRMDDLEFPREVTIHWTRGVVDERKSIFRPLHQWIGSFVRNNVDKDAWVKIMARSLPPSSSSTRIVIDDLRYLNEAQMLKDLGFTIVRVDRPKELRRRSVLQAFYKDTGRWPKDQELEDILNHESEVEVPLIQADVEICNDFRDTDYLESWAVILDVDR